MSDQLERFECSQDQLITFETDELTAHCPFEFGGPDHYVLELRYRTAEHTVESKSLKQYLQSYRDVEISAEQLAQQIHDDVESCIEPDALLVTLEQARRGGIEETVEVGDVGL